MMVMIAANAGELDRLMRGRKDLGFASRQLITDLKTGEGR